MVPFDKFDTLLCRAASANRLVLLDGAKGRKGEKLAGLAGFLLKNGGVVLSSCQLECEDRRVPDATMTGWLLDEFLEASRSSGLVESTTLASEFNDSKCGTSQEDLDAFITKKYDTTGGSARLMFEYTEAEAAVELKAALKTLSEVEKKEVLFGTFSNTHTKAKNILVQVYSTEFGKYGVDDVLPIFTSKLVLTHKRASITLQDIKKLYNVCTDLHQVIAGWVFEELQLRLFEHDKKHNDAEVTLDVRNLDGEGFQMTGEGSQTKSWKTATVVTFKTKHFFKFHQLFDPFNTVIELDRFDSIILRPDITDNESWDALWIKISTTEASLTFLEATLKKSHTANESALFRSFQGIKEVLSGKRTVSLKVTHLFLTAQALVHYCNFCLFSCWTGATYRLGREGCVFYVLFPVHHIPPAYYTTSQHVDSLQRG